ncbi:MAG: glycoside hydrolase family 5 protein [Treponema sp.]|nr:glycoside hydrolase family 5 protein [Treponema sp.]
MKDFTGFKKGINLGGWLSQSSLKKNHMDTFITIDDLKKISSWGLDHIRVPIDYSLVQDEDGNIIQTGFEYIDQCISMCEEVGLNLILDLHRIHGYYFIDGATDNKFFHNEKLVMHYLNLWIEFAKRYGSKPERVAFELINAIMNKEDQAAWINIAKSAVSLIRVYAPKTKLLIPGGNHSSIHAISTMADFHDENIGFSFHCYEPLLFCQQRAYWRLDFPQDQKMDFPVTTKEYFDVLAKHPQLKYTEANTCADYLSPDSTGSNYFIKLFKRAVEYAEKMDTFIYCVEYGVIDRADNSSTLQWLMQIHEAFEKYNIGRALWTYKGMDYGLCDQRFEGLREMVLQYM